MRRPTGCTARLRPRPLGAPHRPEAPSGGGARDYAELGEALEVWTLDVRTVLEDLFRRIAFSIVIHNTDDHLRNLGLLRIDGSWGLAPAFDLNPEPSLEKPRATALFGTDRTAALSRAFGV